MPDWDNQSIDDGVLTCLRILSSYGDSGAADALKGNVVINGNITGGATAIGVSATAEIKGDVTINSEKTVKGGKAVSLGAVSAGGPTGSTGKLTNNGTLEGDTVGLELNGVVAGGFENAAGAVIKATGASGVAMELKAGADGSGNIANSGTIEATGASGTALKISGALDSGEKVTNAGTIKGTTAVIYADGTNNTKLALDNAGTIDGIISGAGSSDGIDLTNKSSGQIKSSSINTGSGILTNEAGATITSTGTITTGAKLTNAGGITSTGNVTVSAGGFDNGASDNKTASFKTDAALDITGAVTNYGSLTVGDGTATDLFDASGLITNHGTITVVTTAATGDALDADAGLTNETGGIIKVTGELDVAGGALTNKGTLTASKVAITGQAFTNTGTATTGVLTSDDTVNSNTATSVLHVSEGSVAAIIDAKNGTLKLELTSALTGTPADLIASSTRTTFNADSKIVVTASDTALNTSGNKTVVLVDATSLVYDNGSTTETDWATNDRKISVASGSVLLTVSDVDYGRTAADEITAKLTVASAEDVVKGYGMSVSAQKAAKNLHGDYSAASGDAAFKKSIHDVYGSLVSNTGSEASLKSYIDNIRPDDSNSAAMTGATVAQSVMGNIASRSSAVRTGANYGDMQASNGFWVQGLYGKSDQKAREGALAYKGDLSGMTFGLDREFGDNTTGMAFSYGKSDVDFSRDQKDEVKSYVASVYNIWESGNMYVDTSLSFGSSKHESKRFTGAAAATAKYGSTQLGGQAMVGYYMNMGEVMIEPMAGARLTMVNVDSNRYYLDSDGSEVQSADDVSYRQMELGFGAAVSKAFEVGNGTLTPRFGAMYYHDFVGDQLDTQVNFAGDNYAIKGASAIKNSWELNLGVSYAMGENLDLSAGYTRVMKNDFSSDNFNAKLKYMF